MKSVAILALFMCYKCSGAQNPNQVGLENFSEETSSCGVVTPQMFGALADGKHDDTDAIRRACKTQADTLYFPKGVYVINIELGVDKKIDKDFFIPKANCIIGESRRESIIKLGSGNGDAAGYRGFQSIFSFGGKNSHPVVKNLTFDFNYNDNPITQYTSNNVGVEHNGQQMAINAYRTSSLVVDNCIFVGHSGTNCIDHRANAESDTLYCVIRNCDFIKTGNKSFYKGKEAYHDCSTIALHCDSRKQKVKYTCIVENNNFEGIGGNAFDACECSADSFIFRNNIIEGYVVGVMPLTTNSGTISNIEGNFFKSVARGIGIWSNNNDITSEYGSLGFGQISIKNNRIVIDIEKYIHRPQFATLTKKKGNIYPGGYYGAICGMGLWTKSLGELIVENNIIHYTSLTSVSYEDFAKGINPYNGSVLGFYNLFEGQPCDAYCKELVFRNNTIRQPVSTIIRLTPFNEIKNMSFTRNTITDCWSKSKDAIINDGLISIHPACYRKEKTVSWGRFIIRENNISYDYTKDSYATVFLVEPDKDNAIERSSIQINNNSVKLPRYGVLKIIKSDFFKERIVR